MKMTMSELVNATGTPERTIREYLRQGVVPEIDPAVGIGGYGELHVIYLLAIARLREEEGVRKHDVFRQRIAAMTPEALERFAYVLPEPTEAAPAPAAESVAQPVAVAASPAARAAANVAPAADVTRAREEWTRIVLQPGLELHMRSGADQDVRRLADEIEARYSRR